VDRLILEKLSEMEAVVKLGELADKLADQNIGLATVRSLLASNPERFAYFERRWIPAARLQGQGRPFAETISLVLDRFGGPMPKVLLVQEVIRIRHEDAEAVEPTVLRILERDPDFLITDGGQVFLTRWGFVASDEPRDRALALNQIDPEDLDRVQSKLAKANFRTEEGIAEAVRKVAPVSLKTLGAVAWLSLNESDPHSVLMYDSREFTASVLSVSGFIYGPDGAIHPAEDVKKWVATASKLADRLAPTIELEDAAPIEIKPEDVDRLIARVVGNENSTTATRLLEEFYEITPGTKTFPDDLANVAAALKTSDQIQWVGGDRFRRAGDVPDFINEVPEPFVFQESGVTNEEGELVDVELTDEGLSTSLRRLLVHPLALDVLDEDLQPAPKVTSETIRLVLKSIHRELGTFPLAQVPTGWIDDTPKIQELIFQDSSGRDLQVWANNDARLMYNLFDWWYEQPIESGAVFTLTKTHRPNVFEFAWMDQPDPVVYISSQRMEELRRIGSEAEGKSTLDLLIEVMAHWPKGADYLTILAEVNVVRRSSRRLIASLLSSYQCFYQRSGSPVWHYDPKKLDLGFDKTKRKFVKK
jgi:hypothetical protein